METIERRIDKLGRIVLPMNFRKALGLEGEAPVVISVNNNTITVKGVNHACRLCGCDENISNRLKICFSCIEKIKND